MSFPEDERPPPLPAPRRDPLLDDPVFAEIVSPVPPAAVYAEPVEALPAADLPVAELVHPEPKAPPPAPPRRTEFASQAPSVRPAPLATGSSVPTKPARPQWIAACGVLGCLGIAILGAIALLAYIAITILSEVGGQTSNRKKENVPEESRNVTRPGPIAPTVLVNDVPMPLDGTVDAVGRGAGGRYLLLRIPVKEQLHVFDANKAEIVHKIPLGERNALFAAGAAKLFVYKPVSKTIERFDLLSGQSELQVEKPKSAVLVDALAIGPGSDGPLYLMTARPGMPSQIHVLDTATLELTVRHDLPAWRGREDRRVHVRASHDGTLLGVAGAKGACAIRFEDQKPRVFALAPDRGPPPEYATPSPDGQHLFAPCGVFDDSGKRVLGTGRNPFFTLPAAHGSGLFVSLAVRDTQVEGAPQLHAISSDTPVPLVTLDKGELSGELPANELRDLTPDDRVHLWPDAGLLAILSASNTELQLFQVDVAKELSKSLKAFIAFASDPPTTARRGGVWQYTPRFWTRNERSIPSLLVSGLKDARLEGQQISWAVPPTATGSVEVSITAETAEFTERKAVQKFRIAIVE